VAAVTKFLAGEFTRRSTHILAGGRTALEFQSSTIIFSKAAGFIPAVAFHSSAPAVFFATNSPYGERIITKLARIFHLRGAEKVKSMKAKGRSEKQN
jgi:hypothetical protein